MASCTAALATFTGCGQKKLDLSMRQEHKAGEKIFVDYYGQTVPVVDRERPDAPGPDFRSCAWHFQLHLCGSDLVANDVGLGRVSCAGI